VPAATLPPVDIDGVDFVLDDQPDLHEVLAGLRARRDYAIVPSAGTRGIWEGLRSEAPVGMLPRVCPEAVIGHGIDIPAQPPMLFAINAANRDPAVYPEPDTFDIARRATPLVGFGQGPHSCIGNWLAFAELTTALRILLDRLPDLRLAPGAQARITSQGVTTLRGPDTLTVTFDAQ
jgi:cytochrome P450